MQRGFYFSIASVPLFAAIYTVAANPGDNFISRLIKNYEVGQEVEERKNLIHSRLMEEAAADRQLFASSPRDQSGPSIRYPEYVNVPACLACLRHSADLIFRAFNQGSPWNVAAGQGGADLNALTKYYHEKAQAQEEERLSRRKDGKVVSVYE